MYICICNNVTDKDIANAVEKGCHSLESLQHHTQLGTQCGRCVNEACALLKRLPKATVPCYDHAHGNSTNAPQPVY